jgi:hypothetical protein
MQVYGPVCSLGFISEFVKRKSVNSLLEAKRNIFLQTEFSSAWVHYIESLLHEI